MDKLTPNDGDLIAMIKNISNQSPIIFDRGDRLEFNVLTHKLGLKERIALADAVKGKLGERLISYNFFNEDAKAVFYIKLDNYIEFPIEYRAMFVNPEDIPGTKYINRNLHVNAYKVDRKTLENLLKFTGGGTMVVPRTLDGVAKYSFIDSFGTMIDVMEGYYIVKLYSGKIKIMSEAEFKENFYI